MDVVKSIKFNHFQVNSTYMNGYFISESYSRVWKLRVFLPYRFELKYYWFKETQCVVLDNFFVMAKIKKNTVHIQYQFASETLIAKKLILKSSLTMSKPLVYTI